jgi:hypothetical protein
MLENAIQEDLKSIRSTMQMYWPDLNDQERQTVIAKICSTFVNSVVETENVPECLRLCGDIAQKYVDRWKESARS